MARGCAQLVSHTQSVNFAEWLTRTVAMALLHVGNRARSSNLLAGHQHVLSNTDSNVMHVPHKHRLELAARQRYR
jgi:hypothetical protein